MPLARAFVSPSFSLSFLYLLLFLPIFHLLHCTFPNILPLLFSSAAPSSLALNSSFPIPAPIPSPSPLTAPRPPPSPLNVHSSARSIKIYSLSPSPSRISHRISLSSLISLTITHYPASSCSASPFIFSLYSISLFPYLTINYLLLTYMTPNPRCTILSFLLPPPIVTILIPLSIAFPFGYTNIPLFLLFPLPSPSLLSLRPPSSFSSY